MDVTGGWHDAGDLRKWMDATMLNAIGLLRVARNLGAQWDAGGSGLAPLLDEVRWGNRYFLKMQDSDGLVWADVAGGVNGDNSDNHWTDNRAGTADDRYLNPAKRGRNQALFITVQAMAAQAFQASDAAYAKQCLAAAQRCWRRGQTRRQYRRSGLVADGRARNARRRRPRPVYRRGGRNSATGCWHCKPPISWAARRRSAASGASASATEAPYNDAVHSALPALALLELARALPEHPNAAHWRDAVRLHLDEYVLPLAAHSAYAIVPFGVFLGSPTAETYRPLAGDLTYRYFMPVRKQFWWLGMTSHLECYALLLAEAAQAFGQRAVSRPGVPAARMGDGREPVRRLPDDGRGHAQSVSAFALRRA